MNDELAALLAAYEQNKSEPAVWRALAEACERQGDCARAAFFRGLLYRHCAEEPPTLAGEPRCLERFGLGMTDPRFSAFFTSTKIGGGQQLVAANSGVLMRWLPALDAAPPNDGACRPYAGLHSANAVRNYLGFFVQQYKDDANFTKEMARHVSQDIIPARELPALNVEPPPGRVLVLPLAATAAVNQPAEFRTPTFGARSTLALRLGSWSFYRIDEPTAISSPEPMMVGRPFVLSRSPRRRRLVLNLMIDALPWSVIRRRNYVDVPNLMRFFGEGVIFDNCYSMAEYTYPSLATIETGRTMQDIQVTHPEVMVALSPKIRTLSERMGGAGYHAVCVATDGSNVYNGVMRGYHRVLANVYTTPAHEGVERVIRQLEAFGGECDQFILMHTSDVHPANWEGEFSLETQARTPLQDNVLNATQDVSVSLKPSAMNQWQNLQAIRMADNALGRLFEYLEARFRDDEYVVNLYSDHGVSVHDGDPWMMSEGRTHAAFMSRGTGVPRRGIVDEMVSSVDVYAATLHAAGLPPEPGVYASLPKALGGGREREFTVSNSIYPGQTFKLCIRTKAHEFRLESPGFTPFNCRPDLRGASAHVYTRDGAHIEVNDAALTERFVSVAELYLRENHML